MLFSSLARLRVDANLPEMLFLYNQSIKRLLLIMTFIVAFGCSFSTQIMGVFGQEFKQAHTVLMLLLPGLLFETFSITSATLLQAFNRPGLVSAYCFGGSFTNLLLNLLLIPHWGIQGAALANTCGLLMMAILLYANTCRIAKCPLVNRIQAMSYLKMILIGVTLFVLGHGIQPFIQSGTSFMGVFLLFLVLYTLLIHVWGIYSIQPLLAAISGNISRWKKSALPL
jgi:O-antigen/teichoic acid export membrane protein